MWTGLFLTCMIGNTNCIPYISTVFYPTEEECLADFINGVTFIQLTKPDYMVVDGPVCIEWLEDEPNV